MKKVLAGIFVFSKSRLGSVTGLACVLLLLTSPAFGYVVGFDDLTTGYYEGSSIPNDYYGLNWTGFGLKKNGAIYDPAQNPDAVATGYFNGIISPGQTAFNPYGGNVSIRAPAIWPDWGEPFDLNSAYLTAGLVDDLKIYITGKRQYDTLYEMTLVLTRTPTLVNFNFVGVDTVRFSPCYLGNCDGQGGVGPWYTFVIDDVTVNETVPVPVPATMLLLASGIAGLAAFRKRFRKR